MNLLDAVLPLARLGRFRPPLRDEVALADEVVWFDDYFAHGRVDGDTVAILEPRYHQQNVNYLILGTERALLFDSGPGLRDITPVVRALTALPVTATCSHLHYDHVGNLGRFAAVRLPDLPYYRTRRRDGAFVPARRRHWGDLEGLDRPIVKVAGWWPDAAVVELGGRRLQVLHLPGHSPDGAALLDLDRPQVFVGDLIYPKGAYAFLPDSDVTDYIRSCHRLLELIDNRTQVLTAHTGRPAVAGVPVMTRDDIVLLHDALRRLQDGTGRGQGLFPRRYPVDPRMTVHAGWGRGRRRSGRRPRPAPPDGPG